jgi:hypothetical protein
VPRGCRAHVLSVGRDAVNASRYENKQQKKQSDKIINENHAQYQLSFGMMLGIYVSVRLYHWLPVCCGCTACHS